MPLPVNCVDFRVNYAGASDILSTLPDNKNSDGAPGGRFRRGRRLLHNLALVDKVVSGFRRGFCASTALDTFANGSRYFWCRGYYVDTVGRNKNAIAEYIKNQLQEDIASDQISMKEYIDPFTGSQNAKT